MSVKSISSRVFLGVAVLAAAIFGPAPAAAQTPVLSKGDAVVTGFSGIMPSNKPLQPGDNPLDHFFINVEGPAAQILSLSGLGGAPNGQLVAPAAKRQFKAGEIGQVFAIALDDGLGRPVPNIYLGATSAYGLHITGPDADGDGLRNRIKTGQPGAEWMAGQFGPAPDGNPGTIWRIDGITGAVSRFATLPGNSGPGIGDIVFDARSRDLYVSDLDTGLIHHISDDGTLNGSFDHGVNGRPAKGLAPIADDGKVADITSPAFDSLNPATWGYTQKQRMVYGMAVHNGRLFYAVAGGLQVWSISLKENGGFGGDPRWELDVAGLPGDGPITDMLFDKDGRMLLAQRGTQKASHDYSRFADAGKSAVVRYRLEEPDNAATPSVWVSDPESYAIGMPAPHRNSNGGIALGLAHDQLGNIRPGTSGSMLWTTGEKLRTSAENDADPNVEMDVHGLQGNDIALTRPQNEPPRQSYFADYDGLFNDPEKAGHMGDVEIWQPAGTFTQAPPVYVPWEEIPPPYIPPENPGYDLNLRLKKYTSPKECFDFGVAWRCSYWVSVRNTSVDRFFFGEIRVKDSLVNVPAGTTVSVPQHPAPWFCWWISAPDTFSCKRTAFLAPGASVGFNVHVTVPKPYQPCHLTNIAEITAPIGGSWQNIDPTDDIDWATALIPSANCPPPAGPTNLKLEKKADPDQCMPFGAGYTCRFRVTVTNTGPGVYNGPVAFNDLPTAGTTMAFGGGGWTCAAAGGSYNCSYPPVVLFPGQSLFLWTWVDVSIDVAKANQCKILNKAKITFAPGGTPQNFNPGDDAAQATAFVPAHICQLPVKAIEAPPPPPVLPVACPPGFRWNGSRCVRKGRDCPAGTRGVYPNCERIVEPPRKRCPEGTTGIYPNCQTVIIDPPRCSGGRVPSRKGCVCPSDRPLWNGYICKPRPTACIATMVLVNGRCVCPSGMSLQRGVCRPVIIDPPRCTGGRIPSRKGCVCPSDRPLWNGYICKPRPTACIATMVLKNGRCVCPTGTTMQHGRCRPITPPPPSCTGGRIPVGKACICPRSQPIWNGKRCMSKPIVVPPKYCPRGMTGRPPHCKRIVVPPKRCPHGMRGRPPHCKRIVAPPRRCKHGTIGKWPNCRKPGRPANLLPHKKLKQKFKLKHNRQQYR